jgi:hypothetical protein
LARLGEPERQRRYLDQLEQHSAALPWVSVVIVIGSLASGQADGISDVDLLIGVHHHAFDQAWTNRARLRVTGAVRNWDHWLDEAGGAGTHKWLSADFVLVEALIAVPASGVRLAPPWRVLAGDPQLADRWPARPPISRDELRGGADTLHPVEAAYDEFKARLRGSEDHDHAGR